MIALPIVLVCGTCALACMAWHDRRRKPLATADTRHTDYQARFEADERRAS